MLVRGEVLISPHEVWEGSYTCKVGYLMPRQHKTRKKKVPLLYVGEGLAMRAFRIFNLPRPTSLGDLKSGKAPIVGPSPIHNIPLTVNK